MATEAKTKQNERSTVIGRFRWLMFWFVILGAMFGGIAQSEQKIRELGTDGWDFVDYLVLLSILAGPVFPAGVALLMRWEGSSDPQQVEVVNPAINPVPTQDIQPSSTEAPATTKKRTDGA